MMRGDALPLLVTAELAALLTPLEPYEYHRAYEGAVSRVATVLRTSGRKEAALLVSTLVELFEDVALDAYLNGVH